MKTSPVSFGRAIKVNATPQVANMLAQAANVRSASNKLQGFAKSIFNDTDVHKAKVVVIEPDEVYIFSGEEAQKQAKISADLRKKVKANNDLIEMLPNREVREQRKLRSEVENYNNLHFAIFKMRNLVEDGVNCRPHSTLDISSRVVRNQFFGDYEEIESAKYSRTINGEKKTFEYNV